MTLSLKTLLLQHFKNKLVEINIAIDIRNGIYILQVLVTTERMKSNQVFNSNTWNISIPGII